MMAPNEDIQVLVNASASAEFAAQFADQGEKVSDSAAANPTFKIDDAAFSAYSITGVPEASAPAVAAPEPATWAMLLIGFAGMGCSPGEVILEKGHPVSDAIVLISGEMEAIVSSKSRMALRPGQLIGDSGASSGLASPVDVVARSYGTRPKWDLGRLAEFTASRPVLRAKLSNIVSADLAAKLRDVTATVSGLAGEDIAPALPTPT